jgi:hypothetical protein
VIFEDRIGVLERRNTSIHTTQRFVQATDLRLSLGYGGICLFKFMKVPRKVSLDAVSGESSVLGAAKCREGATCIECDVTV